MAPHSVDDSARSFERHLRVGASPRREAVGASGTWGLVPDALVDLALPLVSSHQVEDPAGDGQQHHELARRARFVLVPEVVAVLWHQVGFVGGLTHHPILLGVNGVTAKAGS